MYQHHIDRRSASNREEHLAKFQMKHRRHEYPRKLRQTVRAAEEGRVFQTVDDEHAEDGGGEDVAEVADDGRRRLLL